MRASDEQIHAAVRTALARFRQDRRPDPIPHPSLMVLRVSAGSDGDGACLIEPAVGCNHCGYCQSLGH